MEPRSESRRIFAYLPFLVLAAAILVAAYHISVYW
jgi:hypothetical protein